jgi:hypothetical protein
VRTLLSALIVAFIAPSAAAQVTASTLPSPGVYPPAAPTDPTRLTTQAISVQLLALKELILTRLDANDKAVALLHDDSVRVPTAIDKALGQLKETEAEKFRGVQIQFDGIETQIRERDTGVDQAAKANKVNLDSALLAQKALTDQQNIGNALAAAKTEDNFKKQIQDLTTLMGASSKAQDDKINLLNSQLAVITGRSQGNTDSFAWMAAAGGVLIAIISVVVSLFRRPASSIRDR